MYGWFVFYGLMGMMVWLLCMMFVDGMILICLWEENEELFVYVMGGYGFFGVILDFEVDMVFNWFLKFLFDIVLVIDFVKYFMLVI